MQHGCLPGFPGFSPSGSPAVLTPGEEDGVELEAAAVLQPAGQLAEEAAVQVEGDFQGLPTALHLVAHWSVCTYRERKRDRKQVNKEQNQALGEKCPHHLRETNRNKPLIVLLFTQRDLRGAERFSTVPSCCATAALTQLGAAPRLLNTPLPNRFDEPFCASLSASCT